MFKPIARTLVQLITRTRKFYYKELTKLEEAFNGTRILEIGSGRQLKGKEHYSAKHIFPNEKEFRQTDVNTEHGHEYLDITKMTIKEQYDVILCLNVLEHVYQTELAVSNLYNALEKGGTLIVAVPFAFPLHDEPHDYYRFTNHALKKILSEFSHVSIKHNGARICPFGYFVVAVK